LLLFHLTRRSADRPQATASWPPPCSRRPALSGPTCRKTVPISSTYPLSLARL